jgi:hypothetical protein
LSLLDIARELKSQDNACTADPIFVVQRCVRTYGFDPAYSSDHNVYVETDDYTEISDFSDYHCARCEVALSKEAFQDLECQCGAYLDLDEMNVAHTAYQDHWENVQPFFTRKGAEEYLRANGHNLRGKQAPRIFVDSAYRNYEWQLIRGALLSLLERQGWKGE